MPVCPTLSHSVKHELRGISPHIEPKWNARLERWEIWFNDHLKEPYIIVVTKNHFDKRVIDQIRYDFWWSRDIKNNSIKMQNEAEYAKIKRDEQLNDDFVQVSKETEPLVKSLIDAGSSSHGESKFMFPGVGESKIFGGDDGGTK